MGISVAVIDTGIYNHRDFSGRIVGFKDFVNNRTMPYDDSGHGTHVAGIIAGSGAASNGKYRGIAPQSSLVGIKVLDRYGNGSINDVVAGLEWVGRNSINYGIRVVNISFGTTGKNAVNETKRLVNAVEKLWDEGIVVIAAAGNSGPARSSVTAPGNSCKIITVGAFDDSTSVNFRSRNVKYYSGRGPAEKCEVKPEVVVTGTNIIACSNRPDSYSMKSGTSMAAPIVSGAVARLLERRAYLMPDEVKAKMSRHCVKIDLPDNQQGWGVLDIAEFVGE